MATAFQAFGFIGLITSGAGRDVEQVLAIGVVGPALVLGRQPPVLGQQVAEPVGDRGRVADEALRVVHEGVERPGSRR